MNLECGHVHYIVAAEILITEIRQYLIRSSLEENRLVPLHLNAAGDRHAK